MHKRGYRWAKNYIETNKKFNFNFDLKFNRYLVECCNKICKHYSLKNQRFNHERALEVLDSCTSHMEVLLSLYEFYFEHIMQKKIEEKKTDSSSKSELPNSNSSRQRKAIIPQEEPKNNLPPKPSRVTSIKDDLFTDSVINKLDQPSKSVVKGYENLDTELKMTFLKKVSPINCKLK